MAPRSSRVREWLAYSPLRRLVVAIAALVICTALSLGVLQAASVLRTRLAALSPSVETPVAAPPTATAVALQPAGGSLPNPAAAPAPTATLGPITGAGARLRIYPRRSPADLTLGGLSAPELQGGQSLTFTPSPDYTATDTLTDTGPGPPGPLTGLPTRPQYANRPPVAVILDNFYPDARPQAGLNRASVVFETVAEGGITRFMAIYLEKDAPIVGPVRSARIYFDDWAAGLHAIYAHAGGNNDALSEIPTMHTIANVDGLAVGAANPFPWDLYWRSTDRQVPHNFWTASDRVRSFAEAVGRSTAPYFIPSLPHRTPAPRTQRPAGGWIHIDFSYGAYNVEYRYDPRCNCYPRSMNGIPHLDAISQRQIAPSNVVVMDAGVVPDPASNTPGSVSVQTLGTGQALFFRDGTVLQGTWRKDSLAGPLTFWDNHGHPVAFNPGQTWFEVVPIGQSVTWQLHP